MMLNTKKKPFMAVVLLLTSLGITTSCIDNSYDLKKDIDMTINVGGTHLAIPVGSTERITLDKIIEVEEGDDLQLVGKEYHLLKSDKIDETNTVVELVTVNESKNDIDPISVVNETSFPTSADIETTETTTGNIDVKATGIDEAVIEIGSLTAQDEAELTIQFDLTGELKYNSATIEKMTIEFPQFLQFKDGQPGLDNNTYTIENKGLDKQAGLTIKLYLTGYLFGDKYGDGKSVEEDNGDRVISIENEEIKVETTVAVKGIDLNKTASLSIIPTATLAEMIVNEVIGTIKPDMDVEPTEVELTNLPDFLQDDEVKLDIANPIFSFKANNPLNANIEMDGVMTGYKGDKITKSVKIGAGSGGSRIILTPSGDVQQTISIVRNEKTVVENGATKVVVSNLNDIIETIPDRISVKLEPAVKTNDYYNVKLGQDYKLNSEYDIDIPLSFGSNLKIVYEETLEDFDLDLEDVEIEKAIISLTADNTIPLEMEIKNENVSALDKNGNKIAGITVTVTGKIKEGKGGETAVTSQLEINLEETQQGSINQLDGLSFKVTAVPGQSTDVQLRSDQWMQLKEMKLKIPNGIKLDLN